MTDNDTTDLHDGDTEKTTQTVAFFDSGWLLVSTVQYYFQCSIIAGFYTVKFDHVRVPVVLKG